jgi:hypothetical protein
MSAPTPPAASLSLPPSLTSSPTPALPSEPTLASIVPPKIEPIPSTSGLHSIKPTGSSLSSPAVGLGDDEEEGEEEEEEEEEGGEVISEVSGEVEVVSPPLSPIEPAELEEKLQAEEGIEVLEEVDEGEEDESSSDGDSESEGEEEEPTLKYSRLGGSAADILAKDSASALAVSTKFIVRLLPPSFWSRRVAHFVGSSLGAWDSYGGYLCIGLQGSYLEEVPTAYGYDQ